MPELLLRMHIVINHSLDEIKQMFNFILNKISRGSGPCLTPDAAALYYFPEVFAKPRDEYITAMLYEIANDTRNDGDGYKNISAYVGNVQIKPISRLWNTYRLDRDHTNVGLQKARRNLYIGKPRSVLKPETPKKAPFTLDY